MGHPLLQQEYGPYGEHYDITDQRFPRMDYDGVCWSPEGWYPDNEGEQWDAYADPTSQVKREECEFNKSAPECNEPLFWVEVDCEAAGADFSVPVPAKKQASSGGNGEGPLAWLFWKRGGWLPAFIVVPVQIAAWAWEMLGVAVMWTPGYLALFSVALIDWLLDAVFLILFGWWCLPCAGIFIWIINLAMLPFMILGWIQRFWLETFGFIVDGWMLLFGFSGCYLRFGKHCYLNPKMRDRPMRKMMDIPWFSTEHAFGATPGMSFSEQLVNLVTLPDLQKSSDILQVRRANRQPLLRLLPGMDYVTPVMDAIYEHIDF